VFSFSGSSTVNDLLDVMIQTIVLSSLWVMLAALVAVYLISEKVISPLKAISRAAKKFASGHFDVRVEVKGKDEVAQLATAFNNMAQSLDNYETTRNTFVANVSHDLRTPMTTISGFIDSILVGAIPPEKHEYYLGVISTEIKRLSRLVTTLLDVSRLQAGERKFVMSNFDICEMARQILISFEQKIDKKRLDVEFECADDSIYVKADRDAIYQVFYNICDNAVKFSYEKGKLALSVLYNRERKVEVSVYNEGSGIPAEDLPYVFERFFKSDKSRGLDKTGVGLGMFITKTIMESHSENIRVESEAGKYCRFVFTLQKVDPISDAKRYQD
jgi:signal transduction histidine kinase